MTQPQTVGYAANSPSQALDLYLPEVASGPFPVVVAIHGGAFAMGDRTKELDALDALLDRGWAVASIDYRLSGEAVFPAAVQDVKQAVACLRRRAADWNLDPTFFAAWGRSAGGHLAAMLGVTSGQRTSFDQPGDDSRVHAVVDWYGPSDFARMDAQFVETPPDGEGPEVQGHDDPESPESRFLGAPIQQVPELVRQANPIRYVSTCPALPPFLLAAGTNDRLVPHQQTLILADALRRSGGEVELHLLPGARHADPRFETELTEPALHWLTAARAAGRL